MTIADREVPGGEVRIKLAGSLERDLLPGDLVTIAATVKSGIYTDEKGVKHPFNAAKLGQYTVSFGLPNGASGKK
jgi:hypothetical protein